MQLKSALVLLINAMPKQRCLISACVPRYFLPPSRTA